MTTEMDWTISGRRDDSFRLFLVENKTPTIGEEGTTEIKIGDKVEDAREDSDHGEDLLCAPDFGSLTDEESSTDLEGFKEHIHPCAMSMAKTHRSAKRPKSDMRVLFLFGIANGRTSLQNGNPDHPREELHLSPTNVGSNSFHELFEPHSRAKSSALPLRVQSPVCMTNIFHLENEVVSSKRRKMRTPDVEGNRVSGVSRYREDFREIQEIGRGCFSRVFKVMNRLTGCFYAIKRSNYQLKMANERGRAMTEVHAMAMIEAHANIVQYHTAWIENQYMFIQMELCECNLTEMKVKERFSTETALVDVLWQVAQALVVVHATGMAHLDIKPENIFYKKGAYKLGDFGCVTKMDGTLVIEEGDYRYTSHEILNEDYSHLEKTDIFSLGATMYELSKGRSLPTSREQFESVRQGEFTLLPGLSLTFQLLLKDMMNHDAQLRPTAKQLLKHSIFKTIKRKNELKDIKEYNKL